MLFKRFSSNRNVRVYPADAVTRASDAEQPARDGDLTTDQVETIWASARRLYETGLHPGIALCVRRRGQVVLDRTIGHRRGNLPGQDGASAEDILTPDTLFCLYSASKAFTAMVIHILDDQGLLHLDDAVCWHIPEFTGDGKERITIRHVLTHRAGIPNLPDEYMRLDVLGDLDLINALICEASTTWAPGRRLAYHPLTGGYVLGEVVRRVTGKDIRQVLAELVLDPLGFAHCNFGVTDEADLSNIAENVITGPPIVPPWSWAIKRVLGVPFEEAVRSSNTATFKQAIIPAGNIMSTANEACRFFQLLLGGGTLDGVQLFEPRTVARAVAEQSHLELDLTFGLPMRYSMGFFLGHEIYSLYGPNTPRAYGHLGLTAVVAYADPDRDISVALLTCGKPLVTPGQWQWYGVMKTIAEVCG